jgi:uncharacterized caspase-like protein
MNDASDFANVLRTLGFEVIEGRNLDKRSLDEKIAEFARKLDKAGIGLFFYAGHAIQVEGDNWLIPIDAPIEGADLRPDRAAVLKTAAINISQVLSKMEAEQRVGVRPGQGTRAHSERGRHAHCVRHQAAPRGA